MQLFHLFLIISFYFYFIAVLILKYFGGTGGFLYVEDVLCHKDLRQFTEVDVRRVVKENDKQRFQLIVDPESNRLKIRANQGHTVEVS